MNILHATRERAADRRYGLGRATAPLVAGLQAHVQADYFCADDLSPAQQQRTQAWTRRLAAFCPRDAEPVLSALCHAWAIGHAAGLRARAQGFSHLHAHDAIAAAGARHALAGSGIAWGLSQHGFHDVATALHRYVHPLPPWLRGAISQVERRTLRAAGWLVFPTALGRAHLACAVSLPIDARWHVIPHARPDWQMPDRDAARARLGWRADTRYLLAVGQLIPLKRFDWIIRALQSAGHGWQLVLLGDGDATPYLQLAASLGVAPPLVTSTDTPALYYAAADAYASASSTESFGLANLEALCAGLPSVCTGVDAVPEVVGDGAWVADDDETRFANLLDKLLSSPSDRDALALRARLHAAAWPDQATVTQRYLAIYAGATHSGNPT